MTRDDLVKAWFAKAWSDLRSAEIILASGAENLPADAVCFHCQQAAEKYLKAYLVSQDIEYPLTHSLKTLVEKAMDQDSEFETIMIKAESLTPYAVAVRYPDDFQPPSLDDADEALAIAREIREFVFARVENDETSRR